MLPHSTKAAQRLRRTPVRVSSVRSKSSGALLKSSSFIHSRSRRGINLDRWIYLIIFTVLALCIIWRTYQSLPDHSSQNEQIIVIFEDDSEIKNNGNNNINNDGSVDSGQKSLNDKLGNDDTQNSDSDTNNGNDGAAVNNNDILADQSKDDNQNGDSDTNNGNDGAAVNNNDILAGRSNDDHQNSDGNDGAAAVNRNGILAKGQSYDNYDIDKWRKLNLEQTQWDESEEILNKRMKIRDTFIKGYQDYDRVCHGQDELVPFGPSCHNWVGLGLTLLDSLDTMYIMGLDDMFVNARDWVSKSLDFNIAKTVSFFETTIRCLGGLMSTFDVTGDKLFLDKAVGLAQRLMPAFNTGSGLPLSEVNLRSGIAKSNGWTGGASLLAEVGTIQLEFKSAADRSGDASIGQKAVDVFTTLDPNHGGPKLPIRGQYPIYIDSGNARFKNNHVTWGAMGDSFYEYLLKYWIYEGKTNDDHRRMYVEAAEGMLDHLYRLNEASGLYYIAEWKGGRYDDKMDELACFTGGMLALGVLHDAPYNPEMKQRHLEASKQLAETCYYYFNSQKSGLSPESMRFSSSGASNGVDVYLLRPETVETMFYLWRLTGDQKYRDYGWTIYESIERECRVPESKGTGYIPMLSVGSTARQDPQGVMQSFFFAETLKYLYLLFSTPHLIPLDVYVFNTEAHPIRIPSTM